MSVWLKPTDCDCWGGVKTACACVGKPVFGFRPSDSEGEAKGSPLCGRQAGWAGCIVGLGCWGMESFF